MFWVSRLPRRSAQVEFKEGEATLKAELDVLDYTRLPNALALGPAVPAAISYEIVWSGPITRRVRVRDTANGFAGHYLENKATMTWSAFEAGFTFVSDPAETSTTVFAELGREANGLFFT